MSFIRLTLDGESGAELGSAIDKKGVSVLGVLFSTGKRIFESTRINLAEW